MREQDFDRLYSTHAPGLFGFLVYRTGDRALSEDLVADTFERALRARRLFDRRRGGEKAWLYYCADLLRDRVPGRRPFPRAGRLRVGAVRSGGHGSGRAARHAAPGAGSAQSARTRGGGAEVRCELTLREIAQVHHHGRRSGLQRAAKVARSDGCGGRDVLTVCPSPWAVLVRLGPTATDRPALGLLAGLSRVSNLASSAWSLAVRRSTSAVSSRRIAPSRCAVS